MQFITQFQFAPFMFSLVVDYPYWLLWLIELIYHLANKILLSVWYTRFSEKGGNSLVNVTYLKTGRFLLIFFQSQWVLLLYLAERVLNESFKLPSLRTRTCSYKGVRNVSFPENFTYVLNLWSLNIAYLSLLLPFWNRKLIMIFLLY